MKTKIFKFGRHILGLLVLIIAVYIPLSHIYSNENKISNLFDINDSNKFMVGIINNGVEDADRYYRLTDSLLCNTWHRYGPWMRGPSWFNGDNLNADISVYKERNILCTDTRKRRKGFYSSEEDGTGKVTI